MSLLATNIMSVSLFDTQYWQDMCMPVLLFNRSIGIFLYVGDILSPVLAM